MNATEEKRAVAELIAESQAEVRSAKRDLIRVWNELEQRSGCSRYAKKLAKIIRDLEAWQNS